MDNLHDEQVVRKSRFLREQVYRKLKESILTIALEPNKRLIEEKLADEMGTSRTPVREAIQKLEKEGLIHKLPRGGFAVNVITDEDIEEVFGIRSVLEGYAAYLATMRATDDELGLMEDIVRKQEGCFNRGETDELVRLNTELHEILYKSARSKKLYAMISDLRDLIYRYRILMFRYEYMASIAIQDHKDMIALMKARHAKRVERLVKKHIIRGMALIKKKMRQEARKKKRKE
ncbi:MAG: putative HTH-type transcriptional regulator YdfH [Syntrophorhabdus sp. PtaU1.Bin050]|nr:MAG: putative HTH-type transcriptional regulator YdfH [Syntrophorhabdus sp. PtaU1.Bin050]